MLNASSIFKGLKLISKPNFHESMNENPECKVFQNLKFFGEVSNNLLKDLLRTNVSKTFELF